MRARPPQLSPLTARYLPGRPASQVCSATSPLDLLPAARTPARRRRARRRAAASSSCPRLEESPGHLPAATMRGLPPNIRPARSPGRPAADAVMIRPSQRMPHRQPSAAVVEQCDRCGFHRRRVCYRSCRDRHCPKCQGSARACLASRTAAASCSTCEYHQCPSSRFPPGSPHQSRPAEPSRASCSTPAVPRQHAPHPARDAWPPIPGQPGRRDRSSSPSLSTAWARRTSATTAPPALRRSRSAARSPVAGEPLDRLPARGGLPARLAVLLPSSFEHALPRRQLVRAFRHRGPGCACPAQLAHRRAIPGRFRPLRCAPCASTELELQNGIAKPQPSTKIPPASSPTSGRIHSKRPIFDLATYL